MICWLCDEDGAGLRYQDQRHREPWWFHAKCWAIVRRRIVKRLDSNYTVAGKS